MPIRTTGVLARSTVLLTVLALGLVTAFGSARDPAVAAPPVLPNHGVLAAVTALSARDVWAVGGQIDPNDPDQSIPLVEHFDGDRWSRVHAPGGGRLAAVSGSAADDAWAVGSTVEHWDGRRWSIVPFPIPSNGREVALAGVAALSPADAWLVGSFERTGYGSDRSLIEHWNGTAWSIIAHPRRGTFDTLSAVAALSASDVWAVGTSNRLDRSGFATLTMHFDGSSWRVVDSPNAGTAGNSLKDVSAASPGDVWAVGRVDAGQPFAGRTLTLHWDGSRWARISSPSPSSGDDLSGVSVLSSGRAWTVGVFWPTATRLEALAERWDGAQWRRVAAPRASLNDVAAVSADDAWAVSDVIERWNGSGWSLFPAS